MSSCYIGYLPKAPDDLGRFVRRVIRFLVLGAIILAVLLIVVQQRFSPAYFEWQQVRQFEGIVEESPYPTLIVSRPGSNAGSARYLLVGPGKHGATKETAGYNGQHVQLQGKLIFRPEITLIEVMPRSLRATGGRGAIEITSSGTPIRVRGEIVDSKCYGGVMNPGRGKVHRDCAVRCLSGGIPPVLLSENDNGDTTLYLLVDSDGSQLARRKFLDRVAEPVEVAGRLVNRGDSKILAVEGIRSSPE